MEDVPQPGSLEAEAGVFCSTFDMTGTRLITGGADKTIKVIVSVSVSLPRGWLAYSFCVVDLFGAGIKYVVHAVTTVIRLVGIHVLLSPELSSSSYR